MSEPKRKYDSTVARIAGNILSGLASGVHFGSKSRSGDSGLWNEERDAIRWAVEMAFGVVAEVERHGADLGTDTSRSESMGSSAAIKGLQP